MKADIVVKSIIFNRKLNRILLVQRSKSDDTGANTWENAGIVEDFENNKIFAYIE